MTKEEILDYVMDTPDNTNRRVLSDMLDEFSSSNGGGGMLVVTVSGEPYSRTLDKTYREIAEAVSSGSDVMVHEEYDGGAYYHPMSSFYKYVDGDVVTYSIFFSDMDWHFLYGRPDDYPTEDPDY